MEYVMSENPNFAELIKQSLAQASLNSLKSNISQMSGNEVAEARDTIKLMLILNTFEKNNMDLIAQILEALIKRAKEIWR
ncbi:hypothetical protein HGA34_05975 [Candidatus Falkowbacteria bacterium]|nr:hypothetical protein [Candidatus Falkowbacteria bacterium]